LQRPQAGGCRRGPLRGNALVGREARRASSRGPRRFKQFGRTKLPVMSGKRAFLELLKQEGVEILFGNPGTTELPLMDALATETELRYVLALQEAAVVAM